MFKRLPFPVIIGVFIGIVISAHFLRQIFPFQLTISQQNKSGSSIPLIYHDFDNNGLSEYLWKSYSLDSSYTGIVLHSYDHRHIQQFNFPGWVSIRNISGGNWLYITDFNEDGVDDIFVFHKWQNRLYLAAIDVDLLETIWDVPIIEGPASSNQWDVGINAIRFGRLHPDSNAVLVFSVFTGQQHFPRGLYVFDVHRQRIIYRYTTGMDISGFTLCDINNDGYQEILLHTYTSYNLPEDFPNPNDHYTWMVILNHQLRPLFPPKRLLPITSGALTVCLPGRRDEERIVSLVYYTGSSRRSSLFIEWDNLGQRKRQIPIMHPINSIYYFSKPMFDRFIYFYSNDQQTLFCFTDSLKLVNQININGQLYHFAPIPAQSLNNLGIVLTAPEILLVDSQLHIEGACTIEDFDFQGSFVTPVKTGNSTTTQLAISNGNQIGFLEIRKNPWYFWRLGIVTIIIIGSIGLTFIFYYVFILVYIIISYFFITLKNNPNIVTIISPSGRFIAGQDKFFSILDLPLTSRFPKINILQKHYPKLYQDIKEGLTAHHHYQTVTAILKKYRETFFNLNIIPFKLWGKTVAFYLELQGNPVYEYNENFSVWAEAAQREIHNIKVPLSSVNFTLKNLELQIQRAQLPPEVQQKLINGFNTQRMALERVMQRILKLLKLTNLKTNEMQINNLHTIIENTLKEFEWFFTKDNITLIKQFDPELPRFCFDRIKMEILLHILIENAIDAMGGKGLLEIATAYHEPLQGSPYVEISIRDTGGGIPESIQHLIFKRRVPTSKAGKGNGLGLLIARDIVLSHSGEIWFENCDGGTKFVLNIPVTTQCREQSP